MIDWTREIENFKHGSFYGLAFVLSIMIFSGIIVKEGGSYIVWFAILVLYSIGATYLFGYWMKEMNDFEVLPVGTSKKLTDMEKGIEMLLEELEELEAILLEKGYIDEAWKEEEEV